MDDKILLFHVLEVFVQIVPIIVAVNQQVVFYIFAYNNGRALTCGFPINEITRR